MNLWQVRNSATGKLEGFKTLINSRQSALHLDDKLEVCEEFKDHRNSDNLQVWSPVYIVVPRKPKPTGVIAFRNLIDFCARVERALSSSAR